MSRSTAHFLNRLRVLWTLQRLADGALVGLGVASATLLIAVLGTHLSAIRICAGFLIGLSAGLSVGFWRRPTLFAAAREADRVLGGRELFGTLVRPSQSNDPAFALTLEASASQILQGVRPGAIVPAGRSAAARIAAVLLAAITMNIAWLSDMGPSKSAIHRGDLTLSASVIPAKTAALLPVARGAEPIPPQHDDFESSSPDEMTAGEMKASGHPVTTRRDAAGGSVAQTSEHTVQPLSPIVGDDASPGGSTPSAAATLARFINVQPSDVAGPIVPQKRDGTGNGSAAPPQYRELIKAYFAGPAR